MIPLGFPVVPPVNVVGPLTTGPPRNVGWTGSRTWPSGATSKSSRHPAVRAPASLAREWRAVGHNHKGHRARLLDVREQRRELGLGPDDLGTGFPDQRPGLVSLQLVVDPEEQAADPARGVHHHQDVDGVARGEGHRPPTPTPDLRKAFARRLTSWSSSLKVTIRTVSPGRSSIAAGSFGRRSASMDSQSLPANGASVVPRDGTATGVRTDGRGN